MNIVLLLVIVLSVKALPGNNSQNTWKNYKTIHRKQYKTLQEDRNRKQIFAGSLQEVQDHNKLYDAGLKSYKIAVNEFSDYTNEEKQNVLGGLIVPLQEESPLVPISPASLSTDLPNSFDWRDQNIVTPVKYQGPCGSCWAFSAVGALEAHYVKTFGKKAIFSEQQLVDCVAKAYGCSGGWMTDSYAYIQDSGGISYSSDYLYTASNNNCTYNSNKPKTSIKAYRVLPEANEEFLKQLVGTQGPVAVAVDAKGDFFSYSDGVYFDATCRNNSYTHAMVIVGYGVENGMDYWLVKNSWGVSWGVDGYIKMARNRNNHCGIANKVSYPIF